MVGLQAQMSAGRRKAEEVRDEDLTEGAPVFGEDFGFESGLVAVLLWPEVADSEA